MTASETNLNLTDLMANCAQIVSLDKGADIAEMAVLSADDPRNVELVMEALEVLNRFVAQIPKGTTARPN